MGKPDLGLRAPIYNDPATYHLGERRSIHPIWPFAIRWQDEQRWDAWMAKGFNDIQLVTLGTVGALNKEGKMIEPGYRLIAAVAQLAYIMENMRTNGLGIPQPTILYPAYANAVANNSSTDTNLSYGRIYHDMATNYFQTFHPNLPPPIALVDKPEGMDELLAIAPTVVKQLKPDTVETLILMAQKYNLDEDSPLDSMAIKSTAYFLAHFFAYGLGRNHNYLDNNVPRLFVVNQSESLFQDMLEQETETVARHLPISPLTDDATGDTVVGYSNILTAAPYFNHRNEPTIISLDGHLPTAKELSRKGGINGNAQQEVLRAIDLIKQDTDGDTRHLIEAILHPYRNTLIDLQQA